MSKKLHTVVTVIGEERAVDLFNVDCFKEWDKKANTIAYDNALHEPNYDRDAVIGDLFELFCQLAINKLGSTFGIHDYFPNQAGAPLHRPDYGTDGFGINNLQKKVLVQCKYSNNPTRLLTQKNEGVYNMILESWCDDDYKPDTTNPGDIRHWVITSAAGVHRTVEDKFGHGKVGCINIKQIRGAVDDNAYFWAECQKAIRAEFTRIMEGG